MNNNMEYKVSDLIKIILKWKKQVLIILFVSILIGISLTFVIKRYYKSVASVLPPKQSSSLSLSGINNVLKSLPLGVSKLAGTKDDPYDYIAILQSRSVIEDVIKKFDLLNVYDLADHSMEKTIKEFRSNSEIEWSEEYTLEIRVWDIDAKRASEITNYLVDILNQRSYELNTLEAHNNRVFIEQRVLQNKEDLKKAEDDLQKYQEKTEAIVITQPTSDAISPIAELYGIKAIKEIELGVLKKTVKNDNPSYKQKLIELETIKEKIKNYPEIGISSLRLYRDVAIQQKIMEFIIPLYEEAKVNEHKDIPIAYVLDRGVPGERPDKPKRVFIVGISGFIGLIFSFLFIAFKEKYSTLENFKSQFRQ